MTATIADVAGQTVTSTVDVKVEATVTTVTVSPSSATVVINGTQQFNATARDQFLDVISPSPGFSWGVTGGGTIDSSGLFTAHSSPSGPHTVTASGGGQSGTASVSVTADDPPIVEVAASADPNPVTETTTSVSVLGAHVDGEASLTYTWSASGPAAVTFNPNSSNAAKESVATFARAGSYMLEVVITDSLGQTTASEVSVEVISALYSIEVSPGEATVEVGSSQLFTATGENQFGDVLGTQPVYSWSLTGGGTIDEEGLFTAGTTPGGPHTIEATAEGRAGTALITVIDDEPLPPAPQVTLIAPEYGQVVTGIVLMVAEASDDEGIDVVEFLVDEDVVGSVDAEPYEYEWDTEGLPEGARKLQARAINLSGIDAMSELVWVYLVDAEDDETPPLVEIISPEDGAEVTERTLWIMVESEDDVGVVSVSFEINDEPVATLFAEPWTVGVDMAQWDPGELILTAIAEDAAGNTTRSEPVTVTRVESITLEAGCGCLAGGKGSALPPLLLLFVLLVLSNRVLPSRTWTRNQQCPRLRPRGRAKGASYQTGPA